MKSRPRLKRKLKVLSNTKCQTDLSFIQNPEPVIQLPLNSEKEWKEKQARESDPYQLSLHNSQSNMDLCLKRNNCLECEKQKRKCANCTLGKLMRQHITGKLKIEDLKSSLTKICLDSDPEYKKTMIEALENFRGNIRERKRASSNRIENFIDAVTCNKSLLIRRNRELDSSEAEEKSKRLPQKPFDSIEQLYLKPEKKRKNVSVENVAVGPSLKIIESVNDDLPVRINYMDQGTDPIVCQDDSDFIKWQIQQMQCCGKLEEIGTYVNYLLKSKSVVDTSMQIYNSVVEIIEPVKKTEVVEIYSVDISFIGDKEDSEEDSEDVKEEFAEAEECIIVKESKSLTAIKRKLSKTKENSCLIS